MSILGRLQAWISTETIHSDIHSQPRDCTQSYPQPRDASSTVPLEGGSARTNLADKERAVSWRNGVVGLDRWPGRRRKVNPFVARFRPVLGIFGGTLPGGSVSRETSAVAATPTAYFTPSNILGYAHLRTFRPDDRRSFHKVIHSNIHRHIGFRTCGDGCEVRSRPAPIQPTQTNAKPSLPSSGSHLANPR